MKSRHNLKRAKGADSKSWSKAFREEVGRQKNPRAALQNLRAQLDIGETGAFFEQVGANPIFKTASASNRNPRRFVDIGPGPRIRSSGLLPDLAWTCEVIAAFAAVIGKFLEYERAYEAAWIVGDAEGAKAALDLVQEELGLSLWLIARRIALLRSQGAGQITDYVNALIADSGEGTINAWLVYMMGYRADPNVSPASYVRKIEDILAGSELSLQMRSHLRYYALGIPPRGAETCAILLGASENLPLIDRYMTLLDVLQAIACETNAEPGIRVTVAAAVKRLCSDVPDDRLAMLDAVLDPMGVDRLLDRLEPQTADTYTSGAYERALDEIAADIVDDPTRTDLYSLAARATSRTNSLPALPEQIGTFIQQMASVHIFADDDATTTAALLREALVAAHRPLAASIRTLFTGRSADPSETSTDAAIEALNGVRLTPLLLRNLPVLDPIGLLDAALARFPESLSLKLQRAVLSFGKEELRRDLRELLPTDREAIYAARALARLGRHGEAIDLLVPYLDDEAQAVAHDARRELFLSYGAAGRRDEALRLVANAYRANPKLHALFQLAPLLDEIEAAQEGPPFSEIALPIAYHVLNRFGGDPRPGAEADAAEEFALSRGADLPSRIALDQLGPDDRLFDIYLDEVCSPSVLDKFMAIENVGQVEIERLEICRILSERDSAGRQRYLDEIREITRRRVVRERFEQVERTKIYVDTDGVKRQAEKTLRDTYTRFLVALAEDGQGSERLDMMRKVQMILSEIEADGVRVHFSDVPASERELMFDRLVRDFMRMLISSQEYGLEAYLSTRVRHGTMGNQLRSAFEVHSLITQKEGGIYQPDRFWCEAMDLGFNPVAGWLSARLARFSEDIDAAIEDLVRRRVQVRSDTCPSGLFRFTSFNYDIIRLQSEITPDTPFDAFLDKVIEQFWKVLEDSLSVVRQYIEVDFLQIVHGIIDELQRAVVNELPGINSSSLRSAIAAARTQMGVMVANVASWFTLARDMERPDYEFGVAVEVAIESIRVCHPSLDLKLERRDAIAFECRGRSLESLVYLLFTALDNAVAHSGFVDAAPYIALDTTLSNGWLELRLANSCVEVPHYEARNETLAELRQRLEADESGQSLASKEGGSGYAKIIRILKHDLLTNYVLEFGYRSATEYEVKIGVEAKAIVK